MAGARPSPRRVAVLTLALLALAAGGWLLRGLLAGPGAAPQPPPMHFEQITLRRGPCFGACPVYRVTVDRAGHVVYRTDLPVIGPDGTLRLQPEVRHGRVPEPALAALVRAVESGAYARLEPDYSAEVTDVPSTALEARGGAVRRRTSVYAVPCRSEEGAAGVPWDYARPVPDIFCSVVALVDVASCAVYWSHGAGSATPSPAGKPVPTPPRCNTTP